LFDHGLVKRVDVGGLDVFASVLLEDGEPISDAVNGVSADLCDPQDALIPAEVEQPEQSGI
jgi:hypothetical protein